MEISSPQKPLSAAESLERRVAELTILYEVSRALQKLTDEEKALYTILVGVTHGRGLGFNRAFILLVDSKEERLEGRLAIGPSSVEEASRIWHDLREKHQTLGELLNSLVESDIKKDLAVNGIVSQFRIPLSDEGNPLLKIMRSREACLAVKGTFEPNGFAVDPVLTDLLGVRSFAVAPLYLADEDLGLLLADNAITQAPIEIPNLRLLQIYAQEASAAIQNIRLYRALMEKIVLCERANLTLRENQHYLLQAERLSTIGRMAAVLAHEIRTPLVSIGGFARRMLRATPPDDPRKEEMDIIVSEVSRIERLVDQVLGYSKLAKPEYKPTDVNNLVRSVLLIMQDEMEKHSVRAVLNLDPSLPRAEVDESQLRQALLNLVTNSIEAMPSGGVLSITTNLDQEYFEIGVSDTGVGITQEHFSKLLTPFFTTKVTGTGLGLAVVSHVANNHNGSLRFDSMPEQGTSFHMRLALNPEAAPATRTPHASRPLER